MTKTEITLITGASKGIGRFLAESFLNKGHSVIGCSRGVSDLIHPDYLHLAADVADEAQVKKVFQYIRKKFGRLDNLINNAGIASMNHTLLTPTKSLVSVLNTNVLGTFLFSREAVKLMMPSKHGRIVNFSTVAVPLRLDGEAIYSASKAAIEQLTRVWAKEFSEFGVTVNSIGPAPVDTALIKNVPEAKIKKIIDLQAIKRLGCFQDVENVVDFFLSPKSDFITGQTIYLGGLS
ncbi:SDR family oxidoreductase [Erysipelotrichia bacterium]